MGPGGASAGHTSGRKPVRVPNLQRREPCDRGRRQLPAEWAAKPVEVSKPLVSARVTVRPKRRAGPQARRAEKRS